MSRMNPLLCFYLFIFCVSNLTAQEFKIFKVEDFDLRGQVKTCLVITDYGREEYQFDQEGRLTKLVTKYNESDYEITLYKFDQGQLSERRVENYLNNNFDGATSFATFYIRDSIRQPEVVEKIVSYEKELIEENRYFYTAGDTLAKIIKIGADGTDEISFDYKNEDEKEFVVQNLNGVIHKTIETQWTPMEQDSLSEKTVITHEYINGEPSTRGKKISGPNGKLLFSSLSIFDGSTEQWILQKEQYFTYDDNGILSQCREKQRGLSSVKEFIYQFDGSNANNWVKEIITPDNTYKSRKIAYYKDSPNLAGEPEKE